VRLVRPDLALLDAAVSGDDALAARLGVPVAAGWVSFADALRHTRDRLAQASGDPRWSTCLFVDDDPPELVGWGGFKGPPDADGTVEIGYEIAPARRGRGRATAAAAAMVADAFADPRVRRVIAHTLPEPNASNHLLENLGFRFDGDVLERGTPVWRWALPRPSNEGRQRGALSSR
jgi:RimJ/RimL family protein N-acetyltransferase